MKRVAILGSTGSIGTQTLEVIREQANHLSVVALAAHSNGELLHKQAAEFNVKQLALFDQEAAQKHGVSGGIEALCTLACLDEVDIVVISVAGVIGLLPTMRAIEAGKDIALASKEVLVAAGEMVMPAVRKFGIKLTPIDSEHSAIFQCLQGSKESEIDKIFITSSGGPFRGRTRDELQSVSLDQALNHPTWSMGGKITIDSATLMNKGLEAIEAKWLFDVDMSQIEVIVHPKSIVHSLVRFTDGSTLAQLGFPSMKLPIQYALLHPHRHSNQAKKWDPLESGDLCFYAPEHDIFPAIRIAEQAANQGKTTPCAMNAANEEMVNAFLRDECRFLDIIDVVAEVTQSHESREVCLESLIEVDQNAREQARKHLAKRKYSL